MYPYCVHWWLNLISGKTWKWRLFRFVGTTEKFYLTRHDWAYFFHEMSYLQDKPYFFPLSDVHLWLVVSMWKSLLILKGVKPFYWNAGRIQIEKTTSIKLEHLTSPKVVRDMTISYISETFTSLKASFIRFSVWQNKDLSCWKGNGSYGVNLWHLEDSFKSENVIFAKGTDRS